MTCHAAAASRNGGPARRTRGGKRRRQPPPRRPVRLTGIVDGILPIVAKVLAGATPSQRGRRRYRTACRRLLARIARANPTTFRQGRADTAAAALIWITGTANGVFAAQPDKTPNHGKVPLIPVKTLTTWFGLGAGGASARAGALLRSAGIDDHWFRWRRSLGTPTMLVSTERARLVALRTCSPGGGLPGGQVP